ncbi:MAG: RHS repeat-associated core domain-containing protein [Bacteroidota bacterium]
MGLHPRSHHRQRQIPGILRLLPIQTPNAQRSTQSSGTLEQFTGKERDTEADLNLDYFGARYYDAAVGRWNGVDPLANKRPSLSPYNYVQNNPLIRIDPSGLLDDYAFNEETGEISLVQKTDDEYDRIVKTDKTGNVKRKGDGIGGLFVRKSKKDEAKIAVNNIEKGILKDGINFKNDDQVIDVGGTGQPSLSGVEDFLTKFSNHIGKEIAGAYLSPESGVNASISSVYIDEYQGNGPKQATISFTKLYSSPKLTSVNTNTLFHTHLSNRGYGRNSVISPSNADIDTKTSQQAYFQNFIILTRSDKYPFTAERYDY